MLTNHCLLYRNYHIFYQLCCGASEEQRALYQLVPMEQIAILNQSDCYVAANAYDRGEDDAQAFMRTVHAMQVRGCVVDGIRGVWRVWYICGVCCVCSV